jgi:hypothetical protein
MKSQNANSTYFYWILLLHKTKIHFKNVAPLAARSVFEKPNFTAFCSKTALFDKIYTIYPAKALELQMVILHIFI